MTRYDIKILGLIGLLLCPAISWAAPTQDVDEPRWYQIELILFKHLDGQDPRESEQWPELAGIKLPADLVELSELPPQPPKDSVAKQAAEAPASATAAEAANLEPAGPVGYEILGEEEYQLKAILTHLKRSSRFRPLLHLAWRQITVDEKHTKPVLLYTGMTDPLPPELYLAETTEPETAEETTPENMAPASSDELSPPPLVPATEEDAKIGPQNPELLGTVRLSVARYLHLEADLIYRTAVAQAMAKPISDLDLWYERPYATLHEPQGPAYTLETWQALRGFRMFESRRMRSKELHYLDNPFFGLVVLVTPYELPTAEEETTGVPVPLKTLN